MRLLRIVDLSGHALGELNEEPDGRLRLSVMDETYREELGVLIDELARGPVYQRYQERQTADGVVTETMLRRKVVPGEPGFLEGVQDLLRRRKLGHTRIRGLLLLNEEG